MRGKNCNTIFYYIKNQSLALDLVIVFETIKTVLFQPQAEDEKREKVEKEKGKKFRWF